MGAQQFLGLGGSRPIQQVGTPVPQTPDPLTQPVDITALYNDPARLQEVRTQLQRSSDPRAAEFLATLDAAISNYGSLMAQGARVVLCPGEGNGGHPVLALMPPDFDASQPFIVHTHYHGLDEQAARLEDRATALWEQPGGSQTIIILPEAMPTDEHGNWSDVESQAETTDAAVQAAIGQTASDDVTYVVSAYSRGGAALAYSLRQDANSVRADRLVLMDCMYAFGTPARHLQDDLRLWANTDNGRALESVSYVHGTNDLGDYDLLGDIFENTLTMTDTSTHALAAEQGILLSAPPDATQPALSFPILPPTPTTAPSADPSPAPIAPTPQSN